MQYMGGKARIAKHLAAEIDRVRPPGSWVWDPFCGGLSMSVALRINGPVWSTDLCVPLISLYRAVDKGWSPPDVDRMTWESARSLPDSDPLKAYCGFGLSWGGCWFHSMVPISRRVEIKRGPERGRVVNLSGHAAVRKSLLKARGGLYASLDFLSVDPFSHDFSEVTLYLDPPYRGVSGYSHLPAFDHDQFVRRVRQWGKAAHAVFVSEYDFPIGGVVWERPMATGCMARGKRAERLYLAGGRGV